MGESIDLNCSCILASCIMYTHFQSCIPMYTHFQSCIPMYTHFQSCIPMYTHFHPCIPMYTHFHPCIPMILMYTHFQSCIPMYTHFHPCIPMMYTHFQSCIPMYTQVNSHRIYDYDTLSGSTNQQILQILERKFSKHSCVPMLWIFPTIPSLKLQNFSYSHL